MALTINLRLAARAVLIAVCICAAVFTVSSADAGKPKNGQIPLTKESVTRWLKAYPAMRNLAIRQAAAKGANAAKMKDPLEALMLFAGDDAARAEADATVKAHGFKDSGEWLSVTYSASPAYGRLKSGGPKPVSDKDAAKVAKQINDMPFLSDKQKRKLLAEAQKQMGDEGVLAPLPENLEIVRGMEKAIDAEVNKGLK